MKSSEIRKRFLSYFESKGHTIVPSSSLIPGSDPTLLFTNAGMVQLKDAFLGRDNRPYVRATSSQRCVRAGGKHNDLENVGYTARHHTFFEMLGNFSFGDYFKRNAIQYAWEFLTVEMKIPAEKLWVTVYHEDDEAADIWLNEIGVPPERLTRIGDKPGAGQYQSDNFWAMGDTGPCGPCSEIFYDHGPSVAGGPPGTPGEDGDRYIEIWNLVFMQFNRDENGVMHTLPKPSVDTGMGLERISAVMQKVHSNYDIDLFQDLIRAAAKATGAKDLNNNSLKVIADHIRACSFLIVDGVIPSNEGRGYVLRRIIRRALRHGYKLEQKQPFFHLLVEDLAQVMGNAYPELAVAKERVAGVLKQEEEKFAETLEHGMGVLDGAMRGSGGDRILDGETVFRLYDTFGFPLDLTADVARERGFNVDFAGFEHAMQMQRERARAANKFQMGQTVKFEGQPTEFQGYDTLDFSGRVLALYKEGAQVSGIQAGDAAVVVLDRTPFYAESGGQVGDRGELHSPDGTFTVDDTQKIQAEVFGHKGVLKIGTLAVGDTVEAHVDPVSRQRVVWNHSATHLLHAALRKVLGTHVTQKGSLVAPDRLRFDFAHFQAVSSEELARIERLVNAEIRANAEAKTRVMAYDAAVTAGAMALFGEKYESEVRVLSFGDFSVELCGGTHVGRTGDIGLLRIVSESGVAAGVRRIEAVTGEGALDYSARSEALLRDVASLVRGSRDDVADKVRESLERIRAQEREIRALKDKLASGQGTDLAAGAVDVQGTKVIAARVEGADSNSLRTAVDQLKSRLGSAIIVLAAVESPDKVLLVAGVTPDRVALVKAGELVGAIATLVGGKGGGRPDFAQAGGNNAAALEAALATVLPRVREKLAG